MHNSGYREPFSIFFLLNIEWIVEDSKQENQKFYSDFFFMCTRFALDNSKYKKSNNYKPHINRFIIKFKCKIKISINIDIFS